MKVANLNADSNDLYYDLAQSNGCTTVCGRGHGDKRKEGCQTEEGR